nr:p2 [Human immunodeficiency virus 1]
AEAMSQVTNSATIM